MSIDTAPKAILRPQPYKLDVWSEGYAAVSDKGDLLLCPSRDPARAIHVKSLIKAIREAGLRTPILVRSKEILHDRVNCLVATFNRVARELSYQGRYSVVYPVKVNQQRRVVEEVIRAEPARSNGQVGLEAGSKPELLAVMALALSPGSVIVCNGYKDREYIRIALMGLSLGYQVFIVIEKLSELNVVLEEASSLRVTPLLGIRARLSTIGKGNWQNTGGEKSKFGLDSTQLIEAIDRLSLSGQLDCLKLLHFHLGSQIANIRDMHRGFQECASTYRQLIALGAPITTVDIGGGLGVDYDGSRSRGACSMNYGLGDYAYNVLNAFRQVCLEHNLPEPDIISESGRALTAHHAVLITDVIASEQQVGQVPASLQPDTPASLRHLFADHQSLTQDSAHDGLVNRSLVEIYHDAAHAIEEINAQFVLGNLGLREKSAGEKLFNAICDELRARLNLLNRDHLEILDRLNQKLSEKLFVNFSLFQSLPDIWGIDQIFPILPVANLLSPKARRVVLQDITCDSDGRIDQYVSEQGVESTLSLPACTSGESESLCIFMVGAYQEILGDMHNLFGDTDSVDVTLGDQGEIVLEHAIRGDTIAAVLQTVHLSPDYLMQNYQDLLNRQGISSEQQAYYLNAFEHSLASYTYLNIPSG